MECFPTPCDKNLAEKSKPTPINGREMRLKNAVFCEDSSKKIAVPAQERFWLYGTMSDLKRFFDNFYAEPDKQKQDAYILKHCTPCKQNAKEKSESVSTIFFNSITNHKVQSSVCNERILLYIIKINASNNITDTKKKDLLTLLRSHWGDDWQQNGDLSFFVALLESSNHDEDDENEDRECDLECEEYQEVDDLHV